MATAARANRPPIKIFALFVSWFSVAATDAPTLVLSAEDATGLTVACAQPHVEPKPVKQGGTSPTGVTRMGSPVWGRTTNGGPWAAAGRRDPHSGLTPRRSRPS